MFLRQVLNDETGCASYLFGCATHAQLAVVDPHVDLVDDYIALAQAQGVPITAVLADGEIVTLGSTGIQAISTPGHALANHAYLITDHRRTHQPWLVLTGDALWSVTPAVRT